MTIVSRRDVLAGLAASGVASVATASGEQRQTPAVGSHAAARAVPEGGQVCGLTVLFTASLMRCR